MFDLEQAIADWRRHMASQGISAPEVLEELESHLRDDVDRLTRTGLGLREAFDTAVKAVGQPDDLKVEFRKVDGRIRALLIRLRAFLAARSERALPKCEDWTPNARQALSLARQEPLRFQHDFIGTEHLLLGLLRAEGGAVGAMLRDLGVTSDAVSAAVEEIIGLGHAARSAETIPLTPRARNALMLAGSQAKSLNHKLIGPEHILLGLLVEGSGVAALVLKRLGVRTEDISRAIRDGLAS
jgi:hypothetical protein